jgi:hypothetical protein
MSQAVTDRTFAAAGSRVVRAYSPSARTSTIVMAMKIRLSVMAALVTWWMAHHNHTVKTHINRIFAKTGSRDRVAAIGYAQRHGIS